MTFDEKNTWGPRPLPTEEEYQEWFDGLDDLLGSSCGHCVTICIDLDQHEYLTKVRMTARGLYGSFEQLLSGYTEDLGLPPFWLSAAPTSLLKAHRMGHKTYFFIGGNYTLLLFAPIEDFYLPDVSIGWFDHVRKREEEFVQVEADAALEDYRGTIRTVW